VESIGKALEKSISHYEKKQYAEAERGVDALLAVYPDFNRALFLKAVILEETGRAGEAEPYYQKSGPLFPLWLRLGLQLQGSDPERALRYFEKVAGMDAGNNLIWFSMGCIHEKMGRLDDARKCFRSISLKREIVSRLLSPAGFLILMAVGAVMTLQRGNVALASLVIASGIVCLFWLRRDGGRALQMLAKKRKYQ
jgi:hypothetical protein